MATLKGLLDDFLAVDDFLRHAGLDPLGTLSGPLRLQIVGQRLQRFGAVACAQSVDAGVALFAAGSPVGTDSKVLQHHGIARFIIGDGSRLLNGVAPLGLSRLHQGQQAGVKQGRDHADGDAAQDAAAHAQKGRAVGAAVGEDKGASVL